MVPAPSGERVAVAPGDESHDGRVPQRFPGVHVVRTRSGGFSIRILTRLVGSGQPLYLIDGAPMAVDPSRGIDWLRLEDVVQIKVLKDPAETTVYGPRGANGVIVITTTFQKRGR
jgi:TonB-dependent SusC/RagA subfamily outer membrane receptor